MMSSLNIERKSHAFDPNENEIYQHFVYIYLFNVFKNYSYMISSINKDKKSLA